MVRTYHHTSIHPHQPHLNHTPDTVPNPLADKWKSCPKLNQPCDTVPDSLAQRWEHFPLLGHYKSSIPTKISQSRGNSQPENTHTDRAPEGTSMVGAHLLYQQTDNKRYYQNHSTFLSTGTSRNIEDPTATKITNNRLPSSKHQQHITENLPS